MVLWHGLGGSTAAPYLRVAAERAAARGHPVLAMNHRGSGGADERTQRPYMTGNTADLTDTLLWARLVHRQRAVFMVGFSLSGNSLLKWLGEGHGDRPDAALAVNPAIDLEQCSRHLLGWPQHAYDLWILRSCRRWVPRLQGGDGRRYRVPALSSLREFDRRYIAPVWGFPDRDTYYREASSARHLAAIRCPTAVLTAADDPIASAGVLERTPSSDAVALHVEEHGGHLGYLGAGRGSLGLDRWLGEAFDHYLDEAAGLTATAPHSRNGGSICAP